MPGIADVVRWSLRRRQSDVRGMYEALSPVMCAASGGSEMLNFGYWDRGPGDDTPASAQARMCDVVADAAGLGSCRSGATVLDVGSGLCAPAALWAGRHPNLDICCINISYAQLLSGAALVRDGSQGGDGPSRIHAGKDAPGNVQRYSIGAANASATALPFAGGAADRVIALESAQHFRPLSSFAAECRRVMSDDGVLAVAIPVVLSRHFQQARLGMLNVTWASEHYALDDVRRTLRGGGFEMCDERLVGDHVYGPLADYYEANRQDIAESIKSLGHPWYFERMIAASMRQMRRASDSGVIEYAILRCRPV